MHEFLAKVRRGLRKPPGIIVRRILTDLRAETDRWRAPGRQARFGVEELLTATRASSFEALVASLSGRNFPAWTLPVDGSAYETLHPGDRARIHAAADAALQHRVDLLGSGWVELGEEIDWQKDYVSGFVWPIAYVRDIDYADLDRANDVKFPWEVSRLQWLIPVGQAYLLSSDERYAAGARAIVDHWISANPYAMSVNWSCTLEAAMRVFAWTWLFHVFKRSACWQETGFLVRFLTTLYLHGEFTERFIERSDINGNHFTADATALVVVGNFFGTGPAAERWLSMGWMELMRELPLQVYPDGVCFEMSSAYHRLVAELFFWAAAHRLAAGLPVPNQYRDRLLAMGAFIDACARSDGTTPLWGDADDARVLRFGGQSAIDHRYLPGLIRRLFGQAVGSSSASVECFWCYGESSPDSEHDDSADATGSVAFEDAGVFIMRTPRDHVFIDCGPVGTGGRGGHGHNDCLAVDAFVDGAHVLSDCGAFTYTRSYRWRNRFRGSAFHNSPVVDDQEQNRLINERYLWNVHYDAVPQVLEWRNNEHYDVFRGEHAGYLRLADPVALRRQVVLERESHRLLVVDEFICRRNHEFLIPLQLAPGVSVIELNDNCVRLRAGDRVFSLAWQSACKWICRLEAGWVSPSYGVRVSAPRLELRANVSSESLRIAIVPGAIDPVEISRWTEATLAATARGRLKAEPALLSD